jgi:hypothetical protein
MGDCLHILGRFLKITQVLQVLGLLFSRFKFCINFDKKIGRSTSWAIFHKLFCGPCYFFDTKYCYIVQKVIITLDFLKIANFFAENWSKSSKTVIRTFNPGVAPVPAN